MIFSSSSAYLTLLVWRTVRVAEQTPGEKPGSDPVALVIRHDHGRIASAKPTGLPVAKLVL